MGLPFYRDPDEVDAENAAAKLDRAAAQRRSTIRREPSIRPGREQSSSGGLTNIIQTRHELSRARIRAGYEQQEADAQIAVLEEELARLRRLRQRNSSRRQDEQIQNRLERQIEHDLGGTSTVPVANDVYLTTNENENAPPTSDSILLPRPARESNLRFEVAANSTTTPTSPQPQSSFMPSPPHSLNGTGRSRPVDGPLDRWETTAPLTQGFAPARGAQVQPSGLNNSTDAINEATTMTNGERNGLETPPPETWESSYPPLRRVPHMSPRPLPRNTIDGLGDRHRSPSPLSEAQEETTWNNLLTTLDNTHNAPSTSTSFASVTDLLSTSRSSSHRSANTSNTSASFGEVPVSNEDACELPPGITEDDVRQIRERHRRTAGRVTAPRRWVPEPGHDDYGTDAGSRHSPVPASFVEGRGLGESRARQRRRDELFLLQDLADRQQSREQESDESWVLAGLPPGLTRPQHDP